MLGWGLEERQVCGKIWKPVTPLTSDGKHRALLGSPPTYQGGWDLGLDIAEAMAPRIPYALCVVGGRNIFFYTSENTSSVMAGLKRDQEEAENPNSEDGEGVAMATRSNILFSSLMMGIIHVWGD